MESHRLLWGVSYAELDMSQDVYNCITNYNKCITKQNENYGIQTKISRILFNNKSITKMYSLSHPF